MPWSGWFRLSSQDFRSWIRCAQKKTLWGGGGTRSQRIFFQLVQLGYGVMILLWSNKVWILLAQLLRFCREKDKCQNCLVARWLSWETHVLLKAASLLGLMVWVLDGTEISSGWILKKKPHCCRWILPEPSSAGVRHGQRSLLEGSFSCICKQIALLCQDGSSQGVLRDSWGHPRGL